jgi:hypothetical protein
LQFEQGIARDVDHQRGAAAEFIGEPAKNERADRAHHETQRNPKGYGLNVSTKLGRDIFQYEYH